MESGTFTRAKAPFNLHKSINLTILSHSSPAHIKGLKLQTQLDPRIDELDCSFVGDEMRLRQITRFVFGRHLVREQSSRSRLSSTYSNLVFQLYQVYPKWNCHDRHQAPVRHTSHRPPPSRFQHHEDPLTRHARLDSFSNSNNAKKGISTEIGGFSGSADAERGDTRVEAFRHQSAFGQLKPGAAVVRIEVCDTGAGLRKKI